MPGFVAGIRGTKMNETWRAWVAPVTGKHFLDLKSPSKEQKPNMQNSLKVSCSKLKGILCGGVRKGRAKGAFVPVGCLRKLYGSPEHI